MIYNKVLVTAVSTHGEQLVRVWRIIVDHHWAASLSGRRSLGPHIEIDCAALKRRAGQAQRTQLLLASEGARGRPSFDKCRQEMSAGATGSLLWRGVGLATVVQDVRESLPLLLWGSFVWTHSLETTMTSPLHDLLFVCTRLVQTRRCCGPQAMVRLVWFVL